MKQNNLPETAAYDIVRGILVNKEGKVLEMSEDLCGKRG
jgi:hypothetical protein